MGIEGNNNFESASPDFDSNELKEEKSISTVTGRLAESIAMRGPESLRLFESEIMDPYGIPLEAMEKLDEDVARGFTEKYLDPFFDAEDVTVKGILAKKAAEALLELAQ